MRILITGANGLLGQKLVTLMAPMKSIDVIATSRGESRILGVKDEFIYDSLDITREEQVMDIVEKHKPEVIIHTAAMTNVDECETNKDGCLKLNIHAVEYLVRACEKNNIYLVHLSTDFIFDGEDGPYTEDAEPNPISYYGDSKLKAEEIILKSSIRYSIARTILVYGITPGMSRSNIILWVKKSLEEKKNIQVVTDQWRTPTLAEDLAMGCFLLATQQIEGIFNIGGKDFLTPYDMAIMVADYFNLDKTYIAKADSSNFSQVAKRPPRTGLNLEKSSNRLGYDPHSFEEGIALLASQLEILDQN